MLAEFEFHGTLCGDNYRCAGVDVAGLLLLGGLDLQRAEATEIDVIATDESVREDVGHALNDMESRLFWQVGDAFAEFNCDVILCHDFLILNVVY